MIECIVDLKSTETILNVYSEELRDAIAMGGVFRSGNYLIFGKYFLGYTGKSATTEASVAIGNIDNTDRKNRLFDIKPPLLGTRIAVISEVVGGEKVFMVKEVHWNYGADDRKILAYTIQPARPEIFQPMEKVKVTNGNPHKTLFKWLEDLCVLNDEHELEVTITHGLSSVENTYRHNLNELFLNKDDEIQHVNEEVPLVMNIMKDRNYAVNDFKVIRNRPDGGAELIGRLILNFTDEGFVPHVLFPR